MIKFGIKVVGSYVICKTEIPEEYRGHLNFKYKNVHLMSSGNPEITNPGDNISSSSFTFYVQGSNRNKDFLNSFFKCKNKEEALVLATRIAEAIIAFNVTKEST